MSAIVIDPSGDLPQSAEPCGSCIYKSTPTWTSSVLAPGAQEELYDGRDGLLIVGHKPLFEPLMVRRAGQPAVVNVDTGCAYGGALTGYIVEEDRFLQVPSRQPPREGFTAPVVATAPQWASVGPARTFARRA